VPHVKNVINEKKLLNEKLEWEGYVGDPEYKWKGVIKIHHGEVRGEDVCLIRFAQNVVHLSFLENKKILQLLLRWQLLWPVD